MPPNPELQLTRWAAAESHAVPIRTFAVILARSRQAIGSRHHHIRRDKCALRAPLRTAKMFLEKDLVSNNRLLNPQELQRVIRYLQSFERTLRHGVRGFAPSEIENLLAVTELAIAVLRNPAI